MESSLVPGSRLVPSGPALLLLPRTTGSFAALTASLDRPGPQNRGAPTHQGSSQTGVEAALAASRSSSDCQSLGAAPARLPSALTLGTLKGSLVSHEPRLLHPAVHPRLQNSVPWSLALALGPVSRRAGKVWAVLRWGLCCSSTAPRLGPKCPELYRNVTPAFSLDSNIGAESTRGSTGSQRCRARRLPVPSRSPRRALTGDSTGKAPEEVLRGGASHDIDPDDFTTPAQEKLLVDLQIDGEEGSAFGSGKVGGDSPGYQGPEPQGEISSRIQ